jgi:hypothetical protein
MPLMSSLLVKNTLSITHCFFACVFTVRGRARGTAHLCYEHKGLFARGKEFLKHYPIREKGKPLTSAKEITKRLRPTWAIYKKKADSAGLGLLAMQLSHADTLVTDVHYANSSVAIAEREERLRSELEAIVQLLLNRQYQDLVGKHIEAHRFAHEDLSHPRSRTTNVVL